MSILIASLPKYTNHSLASAHCRVPALNILFGIGPGIVTARDTFHFSE